MKIDSAAAPTIKRIVGTLHLRCDTSPAPPQGVKTCPGKAPQMAKSKAGKRTKCRTMRGRYDDPVHPAESPTV